MREFCIMYSKKLCRSKMIKYFFPLNNAPQVPFFLMRLCDLDYGALLSEVKVDSILLMLF